MKKIAALIAMTVVASAANAAPVAATGTINSWKSFNAASKAPIPYFVSKTGFDLFQSTVAGDNLTVAPTYATMSINVVGTIDNVTGFGTLTQVGSFTGYMDVDGDLITDDDTTVGSTTAAVTTVDAGSVTITGLSWTLDATGMHQNAGTFSGCNSASPTCNFTVASGNTNDHGNGLGQSVFDFQGITAGFQTLPKSNLAQTTYGANFKTWAATDGLGAIAITGLTSMTAQVASMVNSGTLTTNAANTATLSLTLEAPAIPVPAAAWLMGSSLVGLAGIARRRKMA